MPVRVVRVIDYTYPDHETAEQDMLRWGVPANGSYVGGLRNPQGNRRVYAIHSATTTPRGVAEVPFEDQPAEITNRRWDHLVNRLIRLEGDKEQAAIPPEQKAWFENTGEEPAEPEPYDNPAMQHHPDDGHAHEFSCVRCGVNPPPLPQPIARLDPRFIPTSLPKHLYNGGQVQDGYSPCAVPGCGMPYYNVVHDIDADERFKRVYMGVRAALTPPTTVADGTQGMRRGE